MTIVEARQIFDALCGGKNPTELQIQALSYWMLREQKRRRELTNVQTLQDDVQCKQG